MIDTANLSGCVLASRPEILAAAATANRRVLPGAAHHPPRV